MGRKIQLVLENGQRFQGSFQKFTKQDLYGKKKILKKTEDGKELRTVTITKDGTTILPPGSISSQYIDSTGKYIPKSDLISADESGTPLKIFPPMFSQENLLDIMAFEELYRYDIIRSYILEIDQEEDVNFYEKCLKLLNQNKLYKFQYTYRETVHPHDAIIIPKTNLLFVLIGDYSPLQWTSEELDLDWYQKLADEQDTIDFERIW